MLGHLAKDIFSPSEVDVVNVLANGLFFTPLFFLLSACLTLLQFGVLSFLYSSEQKANSFMQTVFDPSPPSALLQPSHPQSAMKNLNLSLHVVLLVLQLLHRV